MSIEHPKAYVFGGTVAHLLLLPSANAVNNQALCGFHPTPSWNSWYGTGSHHEHEKASKLPVCKNCEKRLNNG